MYRLRTRVDSSLIHIEVNSLPFFFFSKLPYTLIVIRSALFLPLPSFPPVGSAFSHRVVSTVCARLFFASQLSSSLNVIYEELEGCRIYLAGT